MTTKKPFIILLAVVLILPLLTGIMSVASAAGTYTISLKDASGKSEITAHPGDTIELFVQLSDNPGIISAGAQISYPGVISLTSSKNGVTADDFEPNWGNSPTTSVNPYLVWMNVPTGTDQGKLVTYNGTIRKLTFKVADNAAAGDYTISVDAPGDKNLTAETDGNGVIKVNTNKQVVGISTPNVTLHITPKECAPDAHTWSAWADVPGEVANCTENGQQTRTCSTCNKVERKDILASGHNMTAWSATSQPDCTNAGEQKRTCTNTGCQHFETKPIPAKGHSFGAATTTKKPTCTEAGEQTALCTRSDCDGKEVTALAATGHNMGQWSVTKAAECAADGEEKRACSNAGCTHTETRKLAALGHTFSDATVTKEPTCAEEGVKTGFCTRCNKEATQPIPMVAHTYGDWTVTKASTCKQKGTQERSCTVCNAIEKGEVPLGRHQISKPTILKQVTCTEDGSEKGKCSVCKKTVTQTVPALGHNYGDWEIIEAETCVSDGTRTQTCANCNDVVTEILPALNHDFGEPTVIQEPTICTQGILQSKCSRCVEVQDTKLPCKVTDELTGIVFETQEGVFPTGTKVKVNVIDQDSQTFKTVRKAMKKISEKFAVYDISALLNGKVVQPNGKVTVTIPIPDALGENIALYYITDSGEAQKVAFTLSQDGKSLSAELSHFSSYALCDLDEFPGKQRLDFLKDNILIVVATVVLFVALVTLVIIIIYKRRTRR